MHGTPTRSEKERKGVCAKPQKLNCEKLEKLEKLAKALRCLLRKERSVKVVLKIDLSEAGIVDAALDAIGRICDVLIGLNLAYLVQLSVRYLS
jgi:hypothetical protein